MEAPIVGGHTGALPLQGQAARREWRKVSDVPNGQGRIVTGGSGNQSRTHQSGRPRSGNVGQRRSSQNGRMFHPGSSEHSSDSDHHGGDGNGGQLTGGPVSSQEMISQNLGQQDALYDEMHPQQQNEHAAMNTMSMESGMGVMENPDDALEQQLLEVSRKREQLQQAELELRAQFIARSEVHRMQNNYEEQSKQHADLVASLQNEIDNRDQRIQHLEQSIEEREQQHRANQMQATEAVWAKDGLLREQTNELASLRRERDAAVAEQKDAIAQFEAEKSDYTAQIEHLKEQVHDTERHRQEADEQNRTSQEVLLFKDGQLQDAQAWMARAQELDAYHVNANNTLHAELCDRNEQFNQLWMGYQRQLADMERFHTQVVQRLQAELNEAREQSQVLKGTGAERLGVKEERQTRTGNHTDPLQREGNEETGAKASLTNNGGVARGSPIILSHGNIEAAVPVYIPFDNTIKLEQATGLPVVPSPGVVGTNPVLASVGMPVIQQYGPQQQPLTSMSQASPVLQTSFPPPHLRPPVFTTPKHHPSAQQQVAHAHLQNLQQPTQVPHHMLSSSSLQKHGTQPGQPHQQVLDREEGQEHGGILLSQLSSKAQAPVLSVQPSVQKGQEEATVTDPVKPIREGQKVQLLSHSHDQKQVEHSMQHHRQSNSQPERQRQEQQQHSQSHTQVAAQQHDEARQMQHQQGNSSSRHHLSETATSGTEENQLQQKPPLGKSIMAKEGPRYSVANPVNSQQTAAEPIKNLEPVLLDERALLACLVRAVPAEASAKISLISTLPNRLGKMLAPLHWQSYRKQYGRLDEFVSSHKELFVIEGDYIYLREGAHAKVSATTAVAKAAAAAAAASSVGSDRLPAVAVTPVAQVSQIQRGRNAKTSNKDDRARAQPQQDDLNTHKQRSISPQHSKPGITRQNSASFTSRNSVGNGIAAPNNGGKLDSGSGTTGGEFGSNNLSSGNNSGVIDNREANSYGSSRGGGYHGSRQHSSRNSFAGSGQYRKQDNQYRSQTQDSLSTSTSTQ